MPSRGGVQVEGLRKTVRALQELGVDAEDLKAVFSEIAREGSQVAAAHAPRRSGALSGTIRGNRAKSKSVVTAGRARVKYAGPINYGWPKRNIKGQRFLQRADTEMQQVAPDMLREGIEDIARKYGLM